MHRALVKFIEDDAPELARHLIELDRAAESGDANARVKRAVIIWICEQPRSLLEKVDVMQRLEHLPSGFVHLNMYEFTGWYPPDSTRVLQ